MMPSTLTRCRYVVSFSVFERANDLASSLSIPRQPPFGDRPLALPSSRRMIHRTIALMAVVAATGVMLAACDWGAEPPHPSKSSGGPGLESEEPPTPSVALPVGTRGCPFAPVWPTYLPWLGQGQAVPFPLAGRSLDTGDSVLTWAPGGTNAAPSGPGQAVTLIRTGRPVDATAGTPVPVWIEGSSIGLLRNDVPPGTATIAWSLPA